MSWKHWQKATISKSLKYLLEELERIGYFIPRKKLQ